MTNPGILGGKPCVRGTRISVELILELTASGATAREIAEFYPQVRPEDVSTAVHCAAGELRKESVFVVEIKP